MFFLLNENLDRTNTSTSINENLYNYLDSSIITKSQGELYKIGLYNAKYSFVGDLTAYAGDCPLCSGVVACPPRINVLKEGIYFEDKVYGTVRIVASSRKHSCGTIIRFTVNKISNEPIIAIILDRGVGNNDIDLLVENEEYASKKVGRVINQTFEVLREGWNNE